jgi:hypothetical protein
MAHYSRAVLLVPLISWAAPANRGEALFLWSSVRDCQRRLGWLPKWIVGDMAYVGLQTQRRLREELNVAMITKLRPDMRWVEPFADDGRAYCPQGEPLHWLHYDACDQQQWFGTAARPELCGSCWEQSRCPREFAFPAQRHEILLGLLPHGSWLSRHLLEKVRPWVEPVQSYEKNQLGLRKLFLNSLQLTWVMCLLADMVMLLRAHALLSSPTATLPLQNLIPRQLQFSW